jgi:hypothetical protein
MLLRAVNSFDNTTITYKFVQDGWKDGTIC